MSLTDTAHPVTVKDEPAQSAGEVVPDLDMETADDTGDDLFGDDDLDGPKRESATVSPAPDAQETQQHPLEYQEGEEEVEFQTQVEAELQVPKLPPPRSSDLDYWSFRIPNYCKLDSRPFHPDTYVGPEQDEDETLQAAALREKSMSIKLEVQSTVRWRWTQGPDGQPKRQSNSRIIRWSDGTMSLLLGKELFDIDQKIDMSAHDRTGSQAVTNGKVQGLTYLVSQHTGAQVLQSEVLITGTMSLKPTGMQSQTHRMLVRSVGQKHNKVARLRMMDDASLESQMSMSQSVKSAKKPKRARREPGEDGDTPSKRRRRSVGGSSRRRNDIAWSEDDEPDFPPSDEEEEDYDGADSSPRKSARRGGREDKKEGGEYQEDDFVVADSTDDEAGSETARQSKKKRPRGGDDAEAEEDDLDKLERDIEQQEAERRKKTGGGTPSKPALPSKKEEPADDMEVESEEEDEVKVRRAGGGSRRKRALHSEDEEEE